MSSSVFSGYFYSSKLPEFPWIFKSLKYLFPASALHSLTITYHPYSKLSIKLFPRSTNNKQSTLSKQLPYNFLILLLFSLSSLSYVSSSIPVTIYCEANLPQSHFQKVSTSLTCVICWSLLSSWSYFWTAQAHSKANIVRGLACCQSDYHLRAARRLMEDGLC